MFYGALPVISYHRELKSKQELVAKASTSTESTSDRYTLFYVILFDAVVVVCCCCCWLPWLLLLLLLLLVAAATVVVKVADVRVVVVDDVVFNLLCRNQEGSTPCTSNPHLCKKIGCLHFTVALGVIAGHVSETIVKSRLYSLPILPNVWVQPR